MEKGRQNLRIQRWVVTIGVCLFLVKIAAYFLTRSVAILTDALESTVNVAAGFIGLFSLSVAARPRDENHPYGHGKAEFLSAAVEGTLIGVAGIIIIYEAIDNFLHPHPLQKLDYGILLVALTALLNFVMGYYSVRQGKKNNSLALVASGRHLQSDTYSTIGIILGLLLIYFTGLAWLDGAVAILFAFILIFTGYRILRHSIAGIMDEADKELLLKMVDLLNKHRRENWIDLHNLRVIKYGGQLHVDCHLTVPWYFNVREAHHEIDELSSLIRQEFGDSLELFVHSDGCLDFSCSICTKADCTVRKRPFERQVPWTLENLPLNKRHQLSTKT
ncbi:cation transporter [Pseudoflavitalea sp. X16]|uniref:cation diffusion facilitator family transporter n=1 Tax=Paraflavitalea devenefica TaxID=2716334 RepID=UPI0014204C3A|nr:cation diffusion facilitator family transporter [Paraflavitalea devenefica]NII25085.1 cation transporter [Paraflavitalea devenefica]